MKLFTKCSFGPLFLILGALCVSAVDLFAQEFKTARDGVEYAELTRTISGLPVKMNLMRLDLTKVRLDVVHAMDMAIGTETVSSMAKRHGAFAAINAGFFRLDKSEFAGDPAGLLMIDGEIQSESEKDRIAIKIINHKRRTDTEMGHFVMNPWVGSIESRFEMILSGVNRERKDNELVLYNGKFGKSLKNEEGGAAIILTKCVHDRKWRRQSCELGAIQHSVQEVSVPSNGYVILVGPGAWKEKDLILRELNLYQNLDAKKKRIYLRTEDKTDIKYSPAIEDDIIAGVPQLIKNGLIDVTWEQEKASKSFVETRHPRTAVAKLKDGKFLMITVDGRSESSGGISLHDLAALLLEFGAVDAMNLDGGGSTTMYLDGKVVNKPSDKEGERKVSDAILVTLRKK